MKDLSRYPITFGYKAQDNVFYGPNGRVGPYHRGADRACPIGTPIVINGQTIGLTGNTGLSSGPHCHTQAMKNSQDLNPAPYEFKGGKVTRARYQYDFGNVVGIKVGTVEIFYAHLSKINVKIGDTIGDDMYKGKSAKHWYNEYQKYRKFTIRWRTRYQDLYKKIKSGLGKYLGR